jgi:serine/threonine protein kinase
MEPRSRFSSEAEGLVEEFLRRRDAGETVDLEELCRQYPQVAEELCSLASAVEFLYRVRPQAHASLLARLRAQYGSEPMLDVSLDRESANPDAGPSSQLLKKLREPGAKFTRYRLLGEVARGGMGAILRVWDDDLRRVLAMKVVLGRDETGAGDPSDVDAKTLGRFLEEAQITGQLDHPGIVPVHELGLGADGRVYFTMRLVKGRDLKHVFDLVHSSQEDWNQTRALGVILKVCEALSYAHDKGVVHRDLKPANIMVGKYGEVYVMDWGLARVLGREDRHDVRLQPETHSTMSQVRTERHESRGETPDSRLVTMDGDVVGTPSYMPPEQAKGQLDKLGRHSDVYAIGAMLYHLIGGEMPYVPKDATVSQHTVLAAVIERAPQPLLELAPSAPAELLAICEKAMQREIARRYASVEEFANDLRAYLERRVVAAYESGAWAETKKWVQRNKPLAASLAAALVIAVVGVAAFAAKATEAEANATAEKRARADADRNAAEATQKSDDLLSLSAQKDLDDLVAEAAILWPAHPELVPRYEEWLRRAHELIDGRPADPAKGLKKRPSLTEHKAKLLELRAAATPQAAEQWQAERESHPKFAKFAAKQTELSWRSRMLGLESWPSEAAVEAELAREDLPTDAGALNLLAWPWVDPAKPVYGQEVRAVLLARRAVAAASDDQRSGIRDTLSWALFRVGRLDEALAEERTALSEPGGDAVKSSATDLDKAVAAWRGDELAQRSVEREDLAGEVAELERIVSERRSFEYADPEASWWDRALS